MRMIVELRRRDFKGHTGPMSYARITFTTHKPTPGGQYWCAA